MPLGHTAGGVAGRGVVATSVCIKMVRFMFCESHINKSFKKRNNSDAILGEHTSRQFDPIRPGPQGGREFAFLGEVS